MRPTLRVRRWWLLVALVSVALVLLLHPDWLRWLWQLYSADSLTTVAGYLRSFGIWTPVASLLLMTVQAVVAPLPGSLIASANGVVFGLWVGTLLSWLGGLLGGSVAFGIARWLGRDAVLRVVGASRLHTINQLGQREGVWVVLIARLIPLISFDLISYLAGLSTMRYRHFLIATSVGMLPGTFAWTALGHDLARAETTTWRVALIALIFVGGLLGGRWWLRRNRRRLGLD
ncbi:MAG: TVP38/TMEM64 family protein [Chloroflexales bacterium]|nr:TVP38/TMEM64 family protein [Chloroflexales bacterium]